ncbi:MAG: hypothetical protein N2260_05440 [Syntrophobacterales bacterium]|nr:hypothetical protein [Syntrophobacterales bacterium]
MSKLGDIHSLLSILISTWEAIPRFYRKDQTVKRTLQCKLYTYLESQGLKVIADYLPPRVSDRPVDIVVLDESDPKKILIAICVDELITLNSVKSLSAFDAERKIIFTTHPLEKKVKESTFFLRSDIEHYHLKGPQAEGLL